MSTTNVCIIGLGLIGGSWGMALRRHGAGRYHVVGCDVLSDVRTKALALGAVDRAESAWQDAVAEADLIILATPPAITVDLVAPVLKATATSDRHPTVTDVCSIKRPILRAADGDPRFVGAHPMAGNEIGGIETADADLFKGAPWGLVPTLERSACTEMLAANQPMSERLVEAIAVTGGKPPVVMSAEAHDAIVAMTSHIPTRTSMRLLQMSAAQQARDAQTLTLTAGGYRDMTRVGKSPMSMWGDIFELNADWIIQLSGV